jgi:hypothetical protein
LKITKFLRKTFILSITGMLIAIVIVATSKYFYHEKIDLIKEIRIQQNYDPKPNIFDIKTCKKSEITEHIQNKEPIKPHQQSIIQKIKSFFQSSMKKNRNFSHLIGS